jgi:hypothetical protein
MRAKENVAELMGTDIGRKGKGKGCQGDWGDEKSVSQHHIKTLFQGMPL